MNTNDNNLSECLSRMRIYQNYGGKPRVYTDAQAHAIGLASKPEPPGVQVFTVSLHQRMSSWQYLRLEVHATTAEEAKQQVLAIHEQDGFYDRTWSDGDSYDDGPVEWDVHAGPMVHGDPQGAPVLCFAPSQEPLQQPVANEVPDDDVVEAMCIPPGMAQDVLRELHAKGWKVVKP